MTTHLHPSAIQHAIDHLTRIPRPDRVAAEKIRQWAQSQGVELDPQTTLAVTLHYKPNPEGGWIAEVAEQIPLAQALLSKWQDQPDNLAVNPLNPFDAFKIIGIARDWSCPQQSWHQAFAEGDVSIVDTLPNGGLFGTLDDYAVFQGLFRKTAPMQYTPETQVAIDAQAFEQFIWNLNFHDAFIAQLDLYWQTQLEPYTTLMQVNFIAACNSQVEDGSLSEAACELAWRAAGIATDDDTPAASASAFDARMLNVYGYVATDIPCISDPASGLTLLYIPGNSSPLHEFETQDAMKHWLVEQCKDDEKRNALMAHFRLQDLQTGLSYSGLAQTLHGLANYHGTQYVYIDNLLIPDAGWTSDYINYKPDTYSPPITDGLFKHLALRQRQRSHDDAQFLITTNSDVIKAKWRGYLNLTLTMLAPLTIVVPGLGWLVAVGGIAQLGFGLDELINGKNLQEKVDGAMNTVFGALCALPLPGKVWSGSKKLFQTQFDGFVAPSRINGQVGYLLSPPGAPKLPGVGSSFERFFEQPARVEPLPQALDEAGISRQTTYAGEDTLVDSRHPGMNWAYDLETDAFVKSNEIDQSSPIRYVLQNGQLVPEDINARVVTDAMRQNTLRQLGVRLALPAEVPKVTPVNQLPIPKKVFHVWTGEKTIAPGMLVRVARNSRLLKDAGYSHVLYLSNTSADAFAINQQALAQFAPDLQVLPLETQPFFMEMGYTRRYYDAAMEGPASASSHLTAANDMLKYHALYHEGGVYMDLDNDLLAPSSHPSAAGIVNEAAPADWIGNVPLQTTADGLLLEQPTSNPFRGIHQQYNNSVIGSHPNNPTLREVIREMENRLDARPNFFKLKKNWPAKGAQGPRYLAYARALNEMTGVDMLNHVVDIHLPAYRQMKQIYKLLSCPLLKAPTLFGADLQPVSPAELQNTLQSLFSLSKLVKVNRGFGWRNLNP
jgi:hypothetical protein